MICWSVLSRWNDEKENAHFFPRLKVQEKKINFVIIKKNSTFAPEKKTANLPVGTMDFSLEKGYLRTGLRREGRWLFEGSICLIIRFYRDVS